MRSLHCLLVFLFFATFSFQSTTASPVGTPPIEQDFSTDPFLISQPSVQHVPYDYSLLSQLRHGPPNPASPEYPFHQSYRHEHGDNTQTSPHSIMHGLKFDTDPSFQHMELPTHHEEQHMIVNSPEIAEHRRPYRVSQFNWQWNHDLDQLRRLYSNLHSAWGPTSLDTCQSGFEKVNRELEEHPSSVQAIIDGNPHNVHGIALLSKPSLSQKKQRIPAKPYPKHLFLAWIFDSKYKGPGVKESKSILAFDEQRKQRGGDRRLASWLPFYCQREEQDRIIKILKSANGIEKGTIMNTLRFLDESTIQSFIPQMLGEDDEIAFNAARELWKLARNERSLRIKMDTNSTLQKDVQSSQHIEDQQGEKDHERETLHELPLPHQDHHYPASDPYRHDYYGSNYESGSGSHH